MAIEQERASAGSPAGAGATPAGEATARARPPPPLAMALCVGSWLPYSETFIYDQLQYQRRTRARVIALSATRHAGAFPHSDLVVLSPWQAFAYRHLGSTGRVERALVEGGARLIHAHFGLNGAFALPAAERLDLPLAVTFHGHDVGGLLPVNRRTARYWRYQRLAPRLFEYARRLICASTELAEFLLEQGAPADRVIVHHLGVDTRRFQPPLSPAREGAKRVLMVGRLVEKKGTVFGLQAFARTAQRHRDCELRIAGEGPLGALLLREVARLGIGSKVRFLGALSSARILAEMQSASVLLMPSVTTRRGDRESGVIVLKEAGATALPCVATHHGGIPEIIDDGSTGLLVGERDVAALSDALTALLDDEAKRARMGRAARERICKLYDSERQNERLESLLIAAATGGG